MVATPAVPRVRFANAFAAAAGVAIADPALWLVGAAGFLLRGGWVVLAVPIWTLPSPVSLSTLVGPEALGTGGLTPGLARLVLGMLVLGAVLLGIGLVGSAWIEVTTFERLLREPELGAREGAASPVLAPQRRRMLIGAIAAVSAGALIPAAFAGVGAAVALVDATYQEFYLPGSFAVPLAIRVATRAAPQLAVLCGAFVVAELLISVLSRHLITDAFGLAGDRGRRPLLARFPGAIAIALTAWLVTIALVVPGVAAALLGWGAVRDVFLAPDTLSGSRSAVVAAGGATLLFIALWCAAVVLAGVASSIRAALWTAWWFWQFPVTAGSRATSS